MIAYDAPLRRTRAIEDLERRPESKSAKPIWSLAISASDTIDHSLSLSAKAFAFATWVDI